MSASFEVRPSAISFDRGPPQAVIPLERLAEGVAFVRREGLRSLELDSLEPSPKVRQIDFGFLDEIPELFGFECRMNVSKKADLAPLFRRRELRQLGWPARTTPPMDLSSFPSLECLSIKHQASTTGWAALTRLQYLRLSLSGAEDLALLAPLGALERLEVADAFIKSMDGVEHLEALERLDLFALPRLTDISAVARCARLRSLHVHQTRRLSDFSALAGAPVEELRLFTKTDDLEFVAMLPALRTLFCNGLQSDDLAPLLRAKALRSIDLQPRRRSQVPSLEEVIRALGL
ncbi:MAG: hypothetical protein R3B48_11290 [Kofleriaceae bacterium]